MKYYSIREFARKAGISPQRLSALVRQNEVRTNEAGLVAETELEYFFREKLIRDLKTHRNSFLVLTIGKSSEAAADIFAKTVNSFKQTYPGLVEAGSVSALIADVVRASDSTEPDDAALQMLYTRYQKTLLKEFVSRFQSGVFRLISKFADTEAVRAIPVGSLYELLMYGRLYTEAEDKIDEYADALSKGVVSDGSTTLCSKESGTVPMKAVESTFKSIAASLNLVDGKGQPLFTRADLTPEIVRAVDDMPLVDNSIPDNDFIQRFISMPLSSNADAMTRDCGYEAKKIMDSVLMQYSRTRYNGNISGVGSNGFYTCRTTESLAGRALAALTQDISGGYYKNIYIIGVESHTLVGMPDSLVGAITSALGNRLADVKIYSDWT